MRKALKPAPAADPARKQAVIYARVSSKEQEKEGFSIPAMHVDAVFDMPAERVWALVNDCHGYRNTMPRVIDSVETEHAGTRTVCKWTVNMPFPFSNIGTVIEAKSVASGERWHRDYHQISGDFVRNEGYWHVERFGDDGKRARVTYHAHSVMDSNVPDSLVKRGQIKAMHEMIGKMRAALK